mmetsp:Transcript_9124/g.15414  ORF Transcript_9124/g.15414 Transcript_9124/m.15414 type:complete len:328 (-) Transcript_9124:96-1079(-)
MFLSRSISARNLLSRRLSRSKYSTSRILQQFVSHPEGDDRDDDEFIFPVQLSSPPSPHQWLWSGADISRQLDLGADSFLPEKKMLFSREKVKILNVKHKEYGDVLFTLIQDESQLWKISNIAVFGNTVAQESVSADELNSDKVNAALGSMLDILNDKEQVLWKSTPVLDIFSHPYQYICPPYSIKITDTIGKLIKLAEGDRESYLPSCFKLPVCHSDVHFEKTSDDSTIDIKHKVIMQSDSLALVSVDVFAYDRVGMIDAIFEMLVLLEQTHDCRNSMGGEEKETQSFRSDGQANILDGSDSSSCSVGETRVLISSLMIGDEKRKQN